MPPEYIHVCAVCENEILPKWSTTRQRWQYVKECPCYELKRRSEYRYDEWVKLSGIPDKYAYNRLSDFDTTDNPKALKEAQYFLKNHLAYAARPSLAGMALWLKGDIGTGKTMLASSIAMAMLNQAKELYQQGYIDEADRYADIMWVNGFDLFHEAMGDTKTWIRRLERYQHCSLLIIDEIGIEPVKAPSNFVGSYVNDIIEARYNSERSLILTSNAVPVSIPDDFNKRIFDRVSEYGHLVNLTGASKRKPKYDPLDFSGMDTIS